MMFAHNEGYAAEIVCQKISISNELTVVVERMIEAANRDELMLFSSINHEFHSTIIKNAGNEILLKTW